MAIIDTDKMKTPSVFDMDEAISLGLKLPMTFDNGHDSLTKTTLEAVKQNVRNWRYISRILERWENEGKSHGKPGRYSKKTVRY